MIYRRQPCIRKVLYTLLEFFLLGKIRWSIIRFVWDLDTPLSHTAVLALRMPAKINQGISTTMITNIQSICDCGSVVVDVSIEQNDNTTGAINCHCTGCRRYHTGPFISFLKTDMSKICIRQGKEKIGKYLSNCNELGRVERWFCVDCSSKILSVPTSLSSCSTNNDMERKESSIRRNNERNDLTKLENADLCVSKAKSETVTKCFVNLGPVVEDEIPQNITSVWKEELEQEENNLHFDEGKGVWARAEPENTSDCNGDPGAFSSPLIWSGGCSCGACRYDFILEYPVELQHCYCNLCRKLSGSPLMSWIPVENECFQWRPSSSLQIVRTTPFGRRHICRNCNSVMTIVYDEQPDLIWPCAGSLDDSSLPNNTIEIGKCFSRVCHICCRYHPTWLEVRDDGLDRIEEAC